MRELAVVHTNTFRQFARRNGMKPLDVPDSGNPLTQSPDVPVVRGGQIGRLGPMKLSNLARVVVHLDEAIVRGRRLSTIWKNALLPTGYAHSLNWIQEGAFTPSPDGMRCLWPATNMIDLEGDQSTCLIGMASRNGSAMAVPSPCRKVRRCRLLCQLMVVSPGRFSSEMPCCL